MPAHWQSRTQSRRQKVRALPLARILERNTRVLDNDESIGLEFAQLPMSFGAKNE
ncbi:small protein YadW [Citrobacter sp. Awk 4]|uniref:small protein YadW n=1 Tax=Citrobacter sp. Awk 4 TaxID=2963955 RepID=UPI003FA491C1